MTSFKKNYDGLKGYNLLKQKMLIDGFHLVIDLKKSNGAYIHNQLDGKKYLSFYSFFASLPIGFNHPGLKNKFYQQALIEAAQVKPALSDVYSPHFARFVDVFNRVALRNRFKYLFFIEGGSLAVENALKVAFDWKTKLNLKKGRKIEATQIIHFRECFHGRSGYALSLTDSFDHRKTQYFPKFDWPRITHPKINGSADVKVLEEKALQEIKYHLNAHAPETAAIIIEPIQGEGGDNYFRPQFLKALRKIANDYDLLLIFDEVQTGLGLTGKWWCFEHYGVKPDILVFGKKVQVAGIAVTNRIDKGKVQHCFRVSSRINSTFGGNLVDMVRATRYIEIIQEEKLLANIRARGKEALKGFRELSKKFPITDIRGLGGLLAFDLPSTQLRDRIIQTAMRDQKMIILPSGRLSIRFRPTLTMTSGEIADGLKRLAKSLCTVFYDRK